MRTLLQRVKQASVVVDNVTVGKIGPGLLILLGIHVDDSEKEISWMVNKCLHLRIFRDSQEKMNLSVKDIQGQVLIVSQFTLYGDCGGGMRPSFTKALGGDKAKVIYNQFVKEFRALYPFVETGIFGASMEVSLLNDGPVTCLIDSP